MDDDTERTERTAPASRKGGGGRLERLGFSKRGVVVTKTERPAPRKTPQPSKDQPAETETTRDVELEG